MNFGNGEQMKARMMIIHFMVANGRVYDMLRLDTLKLSD